MANTLVLEEILSLCPLCFFKKCCIVFLFIILSFFLIEIINCIFFKIICDSYDVDKENIQRELKCFNNTNGIRLCE